MTLLIGMLGAAVAVLGLRAGLVFLRKVAYARHWQEGLALGDSEGALQVVVLGDSISQGVGASQIERGLVGRVSAYLRKRTGREVQIRNYSRSGATAKDIWQDQLPLADFKAADLVLVEVGANDTRRLTSLEYGQYLRKIIAALPGTKTAIADVPLVGRRSDFQKELDEALGGKGISRARFVPELATKNPWLLTAGDFFHPNDKGYELWFQSFRPAIDEVLERQSLLKEVKK